VILTTSFNFVLLSLHPLYYLPPRNFEQHGTNVIVIGDDFLTLVKWFQVLHHSRTTRCILTWTMREGLVTGHNHISVVVRILFRFMARPVITHVQSLDRDLACWRHFKPGREAEQINAPEYIETWSGI